MCAAFPECLDLICRILACGHLRCDDASGILTISSVVVFFELPRELNLLSVKQLAERDFITALQMLRGKKALVLDATLSGPLGLITEKQTLRENGVEKTFHLLPEPLQTDQSQV